MTDAFDDLDTGPFDPDELVRWAETYGHPEGWAKRAQAAHMRAERLAAENAELIRAVEALQAKVDRPTLWTEATIIEAFQRWARKHGRAPSAKDWRAAARDRSHPATGTVIEVFGRWSAGLARAGFPPNPIGRAASTARRSVR